jgi:hypothetical protein
MMPAIRGRYASIPALADVFVRPSMNSYDLILGVQARIRSSFLAAAACGHKT